MQVVRALSRAPIATQMLPQAQNPPPDSHRQLRERTTALVADALRSRLGFTERELQALGTCVDEVVQSLLRDPIASARLRQLLGSSGGADR